MPHATGRHRAPGRYNPVAELSQVATQVGTPMAKGSAVLAASGGLVAAIAIPAQAGTADDAEVASPAPKPVSARETAAPAGAAVTAPEVETATSTESFGEVEVEPVAKPTGPSPEQLRARAERRAERAAAAERGQQRQERAAERERETQETASERTTASASRDRQRSAPRNGSSRAGSSSSSSGSASSSSSGSSRSGSSSSSSSGSSSASSAGSSSGSSTSKSSSSSASSSSSSGVVSIAKQYIGTPYSFGGSSPSGFDCSGFTRYVFGKAGTSLPRTTGAQQSAATSVSSPRPGDLVFFGSPAYHVGIYVGDGKMIDAPRSGSSVTIRPVFSGVSGYGRL